MRDTSTVSVICVVRSTSPSPSPSPSSSLSRSYLLSSLPFLPLFLSHSPLTRVTPTCVKDSLKDRFLGETGAPAGDVPGDMVPILFLIERA